MMFTSLNNSLSKPINVRRNGSRSQSKTNKEFKAGGITSRRGFKGLGKGKDHFTKLKNITSGGRNTARKNYNFNNDNVLVKHPLKRQKPGIIQTDKFFNTLNFPGERASNSPRNENQEKPNNSL